jgi:hypothetical protein
MANQFNIVQIERLSPTTRIPGDEIINNDDTTFRTDVRCENDDYNDVPAVVEFTIDVATAAEILHLARMVKAHNLYKVQKFDCRARYLKYDPQEDPQNAKLADDENDFRTEVDVLNVTDEEFWFSAYIKHTDIKTSSEPQRVDDLAQRFAIVRQSASD